MSLASLTRLGLAAAVIGGVLFVASNLFLIGADYDEFAATVTTVTFTTHTVLFWLAAILFLPGLVALYVLQSTSAGILGLIGFGLAFIGTGFALATAWSETFALAVLAEEAPELVDEPPGRVVAGLWISFPVFVIGWMLFGLSALRARVLPRGPTIALLVAVLLFIPAFGLPGLGAVFGAAVAWLAYATYMGFESGPNSRQT
jgi:hypothetical protein